MKLTSKHIATIEQAHDYLLEKSKLRLDTPLLSNLRNLSQSIEKCMDNSDDELFILNKSQIISSYNNLNLLKKYCEDAFLQCLEINKWYKIVDIDHTAIHIYIAEFITQRKVKCYGFDDSGIFFNEREVVLMPDFNSFNSKPVDLMDLFKNEYKRRLGVYEVGHLIFDYHKNELIADGNTVFSNGKFNTEKIDINALLAYSKELEKIHNLKITLTFE